LTAWHIVSDDRFVAVAHDGGQFLIQLLDGRRYGAAGAHDSLLRQILEAKKPRKFYEVNIGAHFPVTWAGRCCCNSPCTENAMWTGKVAGGEFHLCRSCSRLERFHAITFAKMAAVPLPKARVKEAA
jgi:hypothetical protein